MSPHSCGSFSVPAGQMPGVYGQLINLPRGCISYPQCLATAVQGGVTVAGVLAAHVPLTANRVTGIVSRGGSIHAKASRAVSLEDSVLIVPSCMLCPADASSSVAHEHELPRHIRVHEGVMACQLQP